MDEDYKFRQRDHLKKCTKQSKILILLLTLSFILQKLLKKFVIDLVIDL